MNVKLLAPTRTMPSAIPTRWQELGWNKLILLLIPATLVFLVFFLMPMSTLLILSFNETSKAAIRLQSNFSLAQYLHFFGESLYTKALLNSLQLGVITSLVSLLLGYPLAYVIAKTKHPGRNTFLTILVMIPLQIDQLVRSYGLMVLLGDNGMINSSLKEHGLIAQPLPLMYNTLGIVIALTQITIPFMVLSLTGIIRKIDPAWEDAARNLGASRFRTFWHVTLPLSMPGILAGSLLIFALSISNFVAPVLLGGWNFIVVPMWIYKLIAEINNWQFASATSVILLAGSLLVVYCYQRIMERYFGRSLR